MKKMLTGRMMVIALLAVCLLAGCNDREKLKAVDKPSLVLDIDSADPVERARAAYALGQRGGLTDSDIDSLIQLLKDEHPVEYSAVAADSASEKTSPADEAAKALVRCGDRAAGALLAALNSEEVRVVYRAMDALGEIKTESAVEPLIAHIERNKLSTRAIESFPHSVRALLKIGNARAMEAALSYLYGHSHREGNFESRSKLADVTEKCFVEMGEAVVAMLAVALDRGDLRFRDTNSCAAVILGQIGTRSATEHLIRAAIKHPDWWVGQIAAQSLVGATDPDPVLSLLPALDGGSPSEKSRAAYALGVLKDSRAVGSLRNALESNESNVQDAAASALAKIRTPDAIQALVSKISVIYRVDEELKKIGADAVDPLIQALRSDIEITRSKAADLLGDIKDQRAVEPLIRALEDEAWNVRHAAVDALGKIRDRRAIGPLISALDEQMMRLFAGRALEWITGKGFGDDRDKWLEWYSQNGSR